MACCTSLKKQMPALLMPQVQYKGIHSLHYTEKDLSFAPTRSLSSKQRDSS